MTVLDPRQAGSGSAEVNLWRPVEQPSTLAPTRPPFVLGVVGDSGSGKRTVADAVESLLGPHRVTRLDLDDYHRFTREERAARGLSALNPVVHNLALMQEHLHLLRQGRPIRNRSYLHSDGTFGPIRMIEPNEIVLVRGLLGFPTRELQRMYDLAVFLEPEPELLFRWKLRRDVGFRGYTEAQVLKQIARHLLDSKEYVLPQAARAHVLVHYELPDWEAADSEVRTTVRLRAEAAGIARAGGLFGDLPVEERAEEEESVFEIPPEISADLVGAWAGAAFPDRADAANLGGYHDETGEQRRRASLAVVEVMIARLADRLAKDRADSPAL